MRRVLAVADSRSGELRATAGQVAAAARLIAGEGGSVTMLVSGEAVDALAAATGFPGVERVVAADAGEAGPLPILVENAALAVAREWSADAVVFAHGPEAMGVAPALAVALGASLVTDLTALAVEGEELVATRTLYGGKVSADFALPAGVPAVLTVQAGAFEALAAAGPPPRSEAVEAGADGYRSLGFVEPPAGDVDIARAELLVSIGRGIGEEENVEPMQRLAAAIGGELGASRPLVDAGWVPASRQVGQSGRTVKPKVYLAFGISGAVQHLAGIRDAGTVIAINTDAEAPIFRLADYGAVADALEVAEHLERIYSA